MPSGAPSGAVVPQSGSAMANRSTGVKLGDYLLSVQASEAQAITLARGLRKAFEWLHAHKLIAEMPAIKVGHMGEAE
jgi:hypothetical protein